MTLWLIRFILFTLNKMKTIKCLRCWKEIEFRPRRKYCIQCRKKVDDDHARAYCDEHYKWGKRRKYIESNVS